MTAAHRVSSMVGLVLLVALIAIAWPARLGGNLGLVIVAGHSMDGTYHSGDLLLTWKDDGYRVDDVIVYRVPDGEVGEGLRVVHRIIDGGIRTGFVTQGDSRDTPDLWRPRASDIDGTPFAVLPRGGYLLRWIFSPLALGLLCALCVYRLVARAESEPADEETDPIAKTRLPAPLG